MKKLLSRFWKEEEGMGTVEIVIIIAVLVAIAVMFRNVIMDFVNDALKGLFPDGTVKDTDLNAKPT